MDAFIKIQRAILVYTWAVHHRIVTTDSRHYFTPETQTIEFVKASIHTQLYTADSA